jgi:hypothetical protein
MGNRKKEKWCLVSKHAGFHSPLSIHKNPCTSQGETGKEGIWDEEASRQPASLQYNGGAIE